MKIIEIRRHGEIDENKNLTYEGYRKALTIGRKDMWGNAINCIFVSDQSRTKDTARAFAEGGGFTVEKFIEVPGLHTDGTNKWRTIINKAEENSKTKGDLAYHQEQYPIFVDREAERLEEVFKEIVDQIPNDGNALAFSHTPIIECLVFAVTGQIIKGLKECEGVVLEVSDDGRQIKLVKEIRLVEEGAV
jgi:broad specificity phosphatase PhoE